MPEAKLQYLKLIIDELEQEIRVLKERLDVAETRSTNIILFYKRD